MKKMKIKTLLLVLFSFGFFFVFIVKSADAQLYVGEYCWELSQDGNGRIGEVQVGLLWVGGLHYTFTGVATMDLPAEGGYYQFPVFGNLEYVNSYFNVTATIPTRSGGYLGIQILQGVLDFWTLSGPADSIRVFTDETLEENFWLDNMACQ